MEPRDVCTLVYRLFREFKASIIIRMKFFFTFKVFLLNPFIIALKVLTLIGDICLDKSLLRSDTKYLHFMM